jgi:hypothetical protein
MKQPPPPPPESDTEVPGGVDPDGAIFATKASEDPVELGWNARAVVGKSVDPVWPVT